MMSLRGMQFDPQERPSSPAVVFLEQEVKEVLRPGSPLQLPSKLLSVRAEIVRGDSRTHCRCDRLARLAKREFTTFSALAFGCIHMLLNHSTGLTVPGTLMSSWSITCVANEMGARGEFDPSNIDPQPCL